MASTLGVLVGGCGGEHSSAQAPAPSEAPRPVRCALCGMSIEADSGFRCGASSGANATVVFDAPKCMFRWIARNAGARDAWAIDYFSRERRDATTLVYVASSDVMGPMGRDLVPIATREQAETFRERHHGGAPMTYAEVTPAIVDALFSM